MRAPPAHFSFFFGFFNIKFVGFVWSIYLKNVEALMKLHQWHRKILHSFVFRIFFEIFWNFFSDFFRIFLQFFVGVSPSEIHVSSQVEAKPHGLSQQSRDPERGFLIGRPAPGWRQWRRGGALFSPEQPGRTAETRHPARPRWGWWLFRLDTVPSLELHLKALRIVRSSKKFPVELFSTADQTWV